MEVHGNISELKKAIEGRYDRLIEEAESESKKQVKQLKEQFNEKMDLLKEHHQNLKERQGRKIKSTVLNQRRTNAKQEFEKTREKLIKRVFEEVEKNLDKIAKSKEYISFVKKHKPGKKAMVYASDKYFKRFFKGNRFSLDKNMVGVKFQSRSLTLDFDLKSLMDAKRGQLRAIIAKELFGGLL